MGGYLCTLGSGGVWDARPLGPSCGFGPEVKDTGQRATGRAPATSPTSSACENSGSSGTGPDKSEPPIKRGRSEIMQSYVGKSEFTPPDTIEPRPASYKTQASTNTAGKVPTPLVAYSKRRRGSSRYALHTAAAYGR